MSDRGEAPETPLGTVVAHYGVAVVVRFDPGETRRFRVARGARYVVGDRVRERGSDGLEVLPGRAVLQRRDTRGRVRNVAANLDIIGIVLSARPASPIGYVDRGIVAARALEVEPIVVVNKSDLDGSTPLLREVEAMYSESARIFLCSAETGEGLEALAAAFAPNARGVFVGTSGVGKSSLLNALCAGLDLEVGEINDFSGLGRHITTNATLHALAGGGELIDTPGFRDFGPVEIDSAALATAFPGFEDALAQRCRFRDCLHRQEPGCVVKEAVEHGRISQARHAAYLDLLAELEESEKGRRQGGRSG